MPKSPKDGMDLVAREQADWPLEQVKQLALELYVRCPFDDEDTERWKDLAREAFWVLDNLDEACKEILRERSEDRIAARARHAYQRLPAVVPFERAIRHITVEKRTHRARFKFEKALSYGARSDWEGVSPKLSAEQKRQLQAQLKKWQEKGIIREEAMRLHSRCERYWPHVVAEQNAKKARKKPKWSKARRLKAQEKAKWGLKI